MNRHLRQAIRSLLAPALALTADPLVAGIVAGLVLAEALRPEVAIRKARKPAPEARNGARPSPARPSPH